MGSSDQSTGPDVALIVDGCRFSYNREELARHSTYFRSMLFSGFAEKDKKELEIEGVDLKVFQLFLDVIDGVDSVSDENVDDALGLEAFLGCSALEEKIMKHLANDSEISRKEQFIMAENHNSVRLMKQIISPIKNPYELDEVVPKDLDSFCSHTKSLVLQKSFELLGIRKPDPPPLPREPELMFEKMFDEFIDQVELQHHHGMILVDLAFLLYRHGVNELYLKMEDSRIREKIKRDPRTIALEDQLENARSQLERNMIYAQLHVVLLKNIYPSICRVNQLQENKIFMALRGYNCIINRDERNCMRSVIARMGNGEIDELYRERFPEFRDVPDEELRLQRPERNKKVKAIPEWIRLMGVVNQQIQGMLQTDLLGRSLKRVPSRISSLEAPREFQQVPDIACFREIEEFVWNIREKYYGSQQVEQNQ